MRATNTYKENFNRTDVILKQPLLGKFVTLCSFVKSYGEKVDYRCGADHWQVKFSLSGSNMAVRLYDGFSGGMGCNPMLSFYQENDFLFEVNFDKNETWFEGIIPNSFLEAIFQTGE